jgi:glycine cleavage system aminomethyltransferase T
MWAEHTPAEAGLEFAVKPDKGDFVGRDALAAAGPPNRRLTCLVLDELGQVVLGNEPVLVDGEPAGFVTSAAQGMSVGRSIAYAWLPAGLAVGDRVTIAYLDRRYGAQVAEEPLFDPTMTRMRA